MKVKASKKGGGLPSLTSPHTPLPEIQRIKQTLCVIALCLLVQGAGTQSFESNIGGKSVLVNRPGTLAGRSREWTRSGFRHCPTISEQRSHPRKAYLFVTPCHLGQIRTRLLLKRTLSGESLPNGNSFTNVSPTKRRQIDKMFLHPSGGETVKQQQISCKISRYTNNPTFDNNFFYKNTAFWEKLEIPVLGFLERHLLNALNSGLERNSTLSLLVTRRP